MSKKQERLKELYPSDSSGNTERPTTEKILRAFAEITLLLVETKKITYIHLQPLSEIQIKILALLNFPLDIYTKLELTDEEPP